MTTRSEAVVREGLNRLLEDPNLRGPAFGRAFAALVDEWLTGLLPAGGGLALVAVGGYGREELAPASDLDLVLVHDKRTDGAAVADQVWYPIWDAGFRLDHSVRTVKEALSLADKDLKVGLGLLDARWIAGERRIADDLAAGARRQWRDRAKRRLPVLEESVRARHATLRAGRLRARAGPQGGRRRAARRHRAACARGRAPLRGAHRRRARRRRAPLLGARRAAAAQRPRATSACCSTTRTTSRARSTAPMPTS